MSDRSPYPFPLCFSFPCWAHWSALGLLAVCRGCRGPLTAAAGSFWWVGRSSTPPTDFRPGV
eukprot:430768-Alexandrium_andersonii.AAC.1